MSYIDAIGERIAPFYHWLAYPDKEVSRRRRSKLRVKLEALGVRNIREALMRGHIEKLETWLAEQDGSDIDAVARQAVEAGSHRTEEGRFDNGE